MTVATETAGPVVLDELDRYGALRPLSTNAASALTESGLVEVRPEGANHWRLLPRGRVGAVLVDDLLVQVNPKERIGLSRLLFLLGYAHDPGFRPEDVTAVEDPELWPALAESLARLAERALAGGVLQGYRRIDDALRTVRGRIRIGDQIARRPGLLLPLEVTYDEFSMDTVENQILRTALRCMASVPRVGGATRQRLLHLDGRLEGVTPLTPGAAPPTWTPSRLNHRYQPALRLAELVLRHTSAETGPGDVRVAAFVVEMWRVFEDFVSTALREALFSRSGHTSVQWPATLDHPEAGRSRGVIRMSIDIVHQRAGHAPLVFDAKYKYADAGGRYPNADHYQMLAYCTALQAPVAWLVYAQGDAGMQERRIVNTGITIMEYPLDLRVEPRNLLVQIDDLVDRADRPSPRRGRRLEAAPRAG